MTTTTDIHTSCPKCGHELRIPARFLGQRVSCKHCGHEFTVREDESASIHAAPPAETPSQPASGLSAIHHETVSGELDRHYRVTRLSLASSAFQRQLEEALNRAAGEGWSLRSILPKDTDCYVIFERAAD